MGVGTAKGLSDIWMLVFTLLLWMLFGTILLSNRKIRSLILSRLSPAEKSVFDIMLGKDVTLQSSPKTIANQKTMVLKS